MAEDVEAVVRELERLQREQARIRAVLEKYQKIEEERKALLKLSLIHISEPTRPY